MVSSYTQTGFSPIKTLQWLFLDLNSFFASVEQNETPSLRGKPVAVVPIMTDSTCAIAASYEAKAYGIKTGTKIYEAKKLCPNLRCVLARHDVYVDYHHRIFEELEKHIPITKVCSVDEAACRLLKNEQELAYIHALVRRIKSGLKANIGPAIGCSIGVAPNAFLAKTASNMQKPDGFTILQYEDLSKHLFYLRLTDLTGIGKNIERRLNTGGIFTIEQFWNLSPKHARKIWGSVEGERFWYKLHGYDVPYRKTQKRVVGHSRVLDPTLRSPDKAYMIARQLTTKAAARLRHYELYARRLSLHARTVDKRRWIGERIFAPTQDNFNFIKSLKDMWQHMLWDTGETKIHKLSISLYDFYKQEEITLDLFETKSPQSNGNAALSESLDAINKRYGSNTINMGSCSKAKAGYIGTKIAFTRIPEREEF